MKHDDDLMKRDRSGLSLTELAVVMGVIALLIAVLLPQVQQSREAARRAQTRNNLKQIAIAMYNYDDAHRVFCPGSVIDDRGQGHNDWTSAVTTFSQSSSWLVGTRPGELVWDDPEQFGHWMLLSENCEGLLFTNSTLGGMKQADGLALNAYSVNSWLFHRNSSVSPRDDRLLAHGRAHTLLVADAFGDYSPIGHPGNWRDVTIGHRQLHGFGCPAREITQAAMVDGTVRDINTAIDSAPWSKMAGPEELRPTAAAVARSWESYRYPHPSFVKRHWFGR